MFRLILSLIILGFDLVLSQRSIFTLKGTVIDKSTKLPIENVNIEVVNTGKGTISDRDGYFELKLALGEYKIKFTHVNYNPIEKTIHKVSPGEITVRIELEPRYIELKPVEVQAEIKSVEYENYSKFETNYNFIKASPSVVEGDIFRTIAIFPGVVTLNDFTTQLYIWGGNFDQTGIFLDGIPIYNPHHFGGIFSMFNQYIISSATLYPGGQPIIYDDYSSGILDIKSKTPGYETYDLKTEISLMSSKLYTEINLSNAGKLAIGVRRIYLDFILQLLTELKKSPYYFYDIFVKYFLLSGEKDMFSVTGFVSKDVFDYFGVEEDPREMLFSRKPAWGNVGLSLNWMHVFKDANLFEIKGYISNSYFKTKADFTDWRFVDVNNDLTDWGVNGFIQLSPFENLKLKVGGLFKNANFNYFWKNAGVDLWDILTVGLLAEEQIDAEFQEVFFDNAPNPFNFKRKISKTDLYFDAYLKLKKFQINAGVKLIHLSSNKRVKFSTNVNLNYNLSSHVDISLIYGRYYQYIQTIKDEVVATLTAPFSVFLPLETPSRANHFIVRARVKDILGGDKFDISFYYKSFNDIISSVDDMRLYTHSSGISYGLNLSFNHEFKWLNWGASYSFGRAFKEVDNYWYPANYDQRHSIKIFVNTRFSRKWDLSLFWVYGSGLPYTPIYAKYLGYKYYPERSFIGSLFFWDFIKGGRNSKYLPDYHRLDIKFEGNYVWKKFQIKPFIQVFNVYNNVRVFRYTLYYQSSTVNKSPGSFIIPSVGLEINLNF